MIEWDESPVTKEEAERLVGWEDALDPETANRLLKSWLLHRKALEEVEWVSDERGGIPAWFCPRCRAVSHGKPVSHSKGCIVALALDRQNPDGSS